MGLELKPDKGIKDSQIMSCPLLKQLGMKLESFWRQIRMQSRQAGRKVLPVRQRPSEVSQKEREAGTVSRSLPLFSGSEA